MVSTLASKEFLNQSLNVMTQTQMNLETPHGIGGYSLDDNLDQTSLPTCENSFPS